ncbi:MDR family oxidoreductase [Gryllotalpicola ginsengisoli]|uniref:MDR family oxidoreductase n=1 Tax=Gryllotalpicola ginsengisoli TaxID=444608 RepID=UPI0003B4CDD0|nr:MDR family oxidoreductase [Gryllotalpicola ginsengisoli]
MSFHAVVIEQTVEKGRIREHRAEVRELEDAWLSASDDTDAGTDDGTDAGTDAGTVALDVTYSGLNYKDALAIAGRPGVARTSPLIPGIDVVGRVAESQDARWQPGDRVLLNGAGLGESRHGGLAERAIVPGDRLVRVPDGLSDRQAAAIGTAGFTAMLSVLALERGDLTPEQGPVVVTGAAGGVGSVAIAVLAKLGFHVVASSGRAESEGDYLRGLGAAEVIDRRELSEPGPALQKRRWAGALDAVGGTTLANLLAQTQDFGTVTACGLAGGSELPTTVMPFILRGVTLAGINSVEQPLAAREEAWARLASDLDPALLDGMTTEITLAEVFETADRLLAGGVRGRTVVRAA